MVWHELGCPVVDKGSSAANLFVDVKSSESVMPAFSTSARDDPIQRRAPEAYLTHWLSRTGTHWDVDGANNPLSKGAACA